MWVVLLAPSARAQVSNGTFDGFAQDVHPGWEALGKVIDRLISVTNAPNATEPPGTVFTMDAITLNGEGTFPTSDMASFLGGGVTAAQLDALDASPAAPSFGSAIAQTFNVAAGEQLTFEYNWISFDDLADDFSFIYLTGPGGTVLARLAGFSDLTSPPDNLGGLSGETGLKTYTSLVLAAGSYRLGLGAFNSKANENSGQSLLMLDNVTLVPEPTTALPLLVLGGFIARRKARG